MSDDTTRVGTRLVKRQSRRLSLVLLAVAATGLIALGAIAAAYYFGGDLADAEAISSPSASAQALDEQGTCVLIVPAGGEAADLIVEFAAHPDGSATDWAKMQQVVDNLKTIKNIAVLDMRADVEAHIKPLEQLLEIHRTGNNQAVNFEDIRSSGLRTAARCMKYAS
jgi:uncharacterized protein YcgI (DUF1989 family)